MNEFLSVFAQNLLLALAPVLAALAAGYLIAQTKRVWALAKSKYPEQVAFLEQIAPMAVKAAEQSNMAGFVKDKKTYALYIVQKQLEEQGYKIDLTLIDAAIEAAVFEEFHREKTGVSPVAQLSVTG